MKRFGKNERCPCGSGQKYKRCCLREGRRWYQDHAGRSIPEGLATDFAHTPHTRTTIIEHIVAEGLLRALAETVPWDRIHGGTAIAMLSPQNRIACLLDLGMEAPKVLFAERTGHIPGRLAWERWCKSGEWFVHPASDAFFRALVAGGLESVVEAYPYLPTDEDAPKICTFVDAVALVNGSTVEEIEAFNDSNPFRSLLTPGFDLT